MERESDSSASGKSHCTGICLPHPRGVPSPKLISHFPPPGLIPLPSSNMVLLTSFSTLSKSCNLCGHRLRGQAAAGREGERREGVRGMAL